MSWCPHLNLRAACHVTGRKSPPRIGVGMVEWSPDSRHLVSRTCPPPRVPLHQYLPAAVLNPVTVAWQALRNDNMPDVVWVYETVTMNLKAVLGEIPPPLSRFAVSPLCALLTRCAHAARASASERRPRLQVEPSRHAARNSDWQQQGGCL